MSDARLRELERRWRQAGSVADEAALLAERVRTGELPRERVELAAWCGLEAARAVASIEAPSRGSRGWVEELFTRWGRVAAVQLATEMIVQAIDSASVRADRKRPSDRRQLLKLIAALRRWVASPTDGRVRRLSMLTPIGPAPRLTRWISTLGALLLDPPPAPFKPAHLLDWFEQLIPLLGELEWSLLARGLLERDLVPA